MERGSKCTQSGDDGDEDDRVIQLCTVREIMCLYIYSVLVLQKILRFQDMIKRLLQFLERESL